MHIKKVLIVEDDEVMHTMWKYELGDRVRIISAFTVQEGERMFMEHPDFHAIIMDACVPGRVPTTLPLVREIRETYKGL